MKKQWILVANGSKARLFSRTSVGDPLIALDTIDFPEGRLKGSQLGRDRQGHENSDHSTAAAHFEPHTSPRKKLLHRFAHELGKRLEDGLAQGEYGAVWIAASNPFLGELRSALSQAVIDRVQGVYEADLTSLDLGSIEQRLQDLHQHLR
ncbi:MAG: host attachment protein [Hydrogenophaga sp.]|nr:host attachment protein [Hydrogenophaga sp.]